MVLTVKSTLLMAAPNCFRNRSVEKKERYKAIIWAISFLLLALHSVSLSVFLCYQTVFSFVTLRKTTITKAMMILHCHKLIFALPCPTGRAHLNLNLKETVKIHHKNMLFSIISR